MTNDQHARPDTSAADSDPASGLPIPIEPGATDLGDDATRDATNSGSGLADAPRPDSDPASGLPIPIEPGATDLGDDVNRSASEG
jgi:hypothetical protein